MFTKFLRAAGMSIAALAILAPIARAQDEAPPPPAAQPAVVIQTVEDQFMYQLLTAPKDGDRKHAAKELARMGMAKSLSALDYAAVNDNDGGVRKAARHSAQQVRARIVAVQMISAPPPPVVVQAPPAPVVAAPPAESVVVPPPPVVIAPAPAPVYVEPAPVYVEPGPTVIVVPQHHFFYYGPSYWHGYYGRGYWHGGYYRGYNHGWGVGVRIRH